MIDIKNILNETGAILYGHFLLRSGNHSDTYVECAKTLQYTWYTREIGSEIALRLQRFAPDCIVSSTPNGMIIGYEVARNIDIPFIYLERDEKERPSFDHCLDPTMFKNLVIVEDLIADETVIHDVILALKGYGAEIIGIASIVRIGQIERAERVDGLQVLSLLNIPARIFDPHECQMCMEGMKLFNYKEPCGE